MHILIANNNTIPALKYGGTERDIWWLGKELVKRGHKVTYLVKSGSYCPFADIVDLKPDKPLAAQIPEGVDLAHFHYPIDEDLPVPYMLTIHGNGKPGETFPINTVFLSANHAERHNSREFVFNGLDPEEYGKPDLDGKKDPYLFLAKTTRKEKNLPDAIKIAKACGGTLAVAGGKGFSWDGRVKYHGIIGGELKNKVISGSKALLFPIRWHEPFGLAVIESLYHGLPVIASNYGSMPELLSEKTGYMGNSVPEMIRAAKNYGDWNRREIHERAMSLFTNVQMTDKYLMYFEKILKGEPLNPHRPGSIITEKAELLPLEY